MSAALLLIPLAAYANDQNIVTTDNGEIACQASRNDLTRITLQDDQFVAVSKMATINPDHDFDVQHEPTRGDIYISVPEGFSKSSFSFFGTTANGYVYKFRCTVTARDAVQIFVTNKELVRPEQEMAGLAYDKPLKEQASSLIKAMFQQDIVAGYDIRDMARASVTSGPVKVQLLSEYQGVMLTGKILRIENISDESLSVTDDIVSPKGTIAISITNAELEPGQATTVYLVLPVGA